MPALPAGVELYRLRDGEEIEQVTAAGLRRVARLLEPVGPR